MRWPLVLMLFISIAAIGGYLYIMAYPYQQYSQWIQGQGHDFYFKIPNYRELYLAPVAINEIPEYKEDYAQLWREFPVGNNRIPLPTRHPLFNIVPIAELNPHGPTPHLGMIFLTANGRELSRIYNLPLTLQQDHSMGQELFKLPYVRKKILSKDINQVWQDIFTLEIRVAPKGLEEMINDLYILHLRSKLLPPETIKYGLTSEGKAVIELISKDKDYSMELVMSHDNGSIYSYVIRTEKQHAESRKLRSKFISSIGFSPIDPAMGRIIYKEFKQLNFSRQADQEGMLYLFSAWSQDTSSEELLREMIFYLERGRVNSKQLKVLYNYAFKKYGKTFSTQMEFDESDPEISLQRKIEIENKRNRQLADKDSPSGHEEATISPKEKMHIYLKKAKESPAAPTKDMTIH